MARTSRSTQKPQTTPFEHREIRIITPFGSAEGYIVDTRAPELAQWISSQLRTRKVLATDLLATIQTIYTKIAILENLYVDDQHRNERYGTTLFHQFAQNVYEDQAQAILLVADNGNQNNFTLFDWYQKLGFKTLAPTTSGPLMSRSDLHTHYLFPKNTPPPHPRETP